MFEHIKKRIIKNLIEEIGCLDPTCLELVGHNVVSILEHKKMIHRGINKDYKPVGYTVDSFADNSTIVSEYSTEKDYFDGKDANGAPVYSKIEKDIKHACDHLKPNGPEKIYLISNQEEPPSFRAKFNATPIAQSLGGKVIIFDSREIGKIIYDQSISNSNCAQYYKEFFPGFSLDLDNYEYYGRLPVQCEKHISDSGMLGEISKHYRKDESICVLHGLSGSGKTQAAIDFIHHCGKDFENYIWISGEDWKPDTSLSSIQRSRGGAPINVAGIFNSTKTIFVIDNFERSLVESDFIALKKGIDLGGIILATSQNATPSSKHYLAIPEMSKDVAFQVLGENHSSSTEACNKFVEACRFLPLMLSTARKIIEIQGIDKDDFYKEVLASPEVFSGSDGASILRKIVSKIEPETREALSKIANSGSSVFDLNFLRHFIGIIPCSNLQFLSILMPVSTPGVIKVHDLLCIATQEDVNSNLLVESIEEYIGARKGEMTPSILRQIHYCFEEIHQEHIIRGDRDPDWLTYALLQVEGQEKQEIQKTNHSLEITSTSTLPSVMCIIDSKEVHSYSIEKNQERKAYYNQCAEVFEKSFSESSCNDVKAELLHHRGKALRRCGEHVKALQCFSQLLEIKPEWHAAHAQIVHLGTTYGVDRSIKVKGEESMRILMESILKDISSVPLRVSLATLARLRSYYDVKREISSKSDEVKKLAEIVAMSSLEGLDQFYEGFVSFTSLFAYDYSSLCVALAETFPEMLALPPESIESNQWVSACEGLANISSAAEREGKNNLSSRIAEAGTKFADAIFSKENLKSFDARAAAKAYIAADLPQKALDGINKVPIDRIDHWILYRKAEALLLLGENDEALKVAKLALDLASKDSKARTRISSYHHILSSCHEKRGNQKAALDEAKIAQNKCPEGKYKKDLDERVSFLEELPT